MAKILSGIYEGVEPFLAQELFQSHDLLVWAVNSDDDAAALHARLTFALPHIPILFYPAWDCFPYDFRCSQKGRCSFICVW